MTTPEITPEIRKAVMDQICAENGHSPDISGVMRAINGKLTITGPDDMHLPHIKCVRCGRVWIVVETGDVNYDAAEQNAIGQLAPETPFRHRIQQLRDKRGSRA